MKTQINRRNALTGSLAAIAAFAPALAMAVPKNDEIDALETLIRHWSDLDKESTIEGKATDIMERELKRTAPIKARILTEPILRLDGSVWEPISDKVIGWQTEVLESIIASKTEFIVARVDAPNGDYSIQCSHRPLHEYALQQYIERRDARLAYDVATESHFSEHAKRQEAWEYGLDLVDNALCQIIDFEVLSFAGLSRKAQFLSECTWFVQRYEYENSFAAVEALVADIARIASQTMGRA